MQGGEMRKGLGDGIVNCRLGGKETGEAVSHLVEDIDMAIDTNEYQLENTI